MTREDELEHDVLMYREILREIKKLIIEAEKWHNKVVVKHLNEDRGE